MRALAISLRARAAQVLKKLGVPAELAEDIVYTRGTQRSWAIDGVDGEAPCRRRKYQLHVHNNNLYVHGGEGRDGELFDDVYMLNMAAKRWSCLYRGENINALSAAGRRVAFVGATLVSVAVGSPGVLDAVTQLDLDALGESQFVPTMAANLAERLTAVTRRVGDVAEGVEAPPEPNDFDGLRKVMGCVYEVRNKAEDVEYEIDALHEIASYLSSLDEAPDNVAPKLKEVDALGDTWTAAKKKVPALRKAIRPAIEAETLRITDEIREFEANMETYREKFLVEPAFAWKTVRAVVVA